MALVVPLTVLCLLLILDLFRARTRRCRLPIPDLEPDWDLGSRGPRYLLRIVALVVPLIALLARVLFLVGIVRELVVANVYFFPLESLVLRMETEALMQIHTVEGPVSPGFLRRRVLPLFSHFSTLIRRAYDALPRI